MTAPVSHYGRGRCWQVAGLNVLRVEGSFYDMGRQHGALLREAVGRGPMPYYRTYIEKMLRSSGLGIAAAPVARLIERGVGGRVARALPDFARETIRGLADGSGMSFSQLLGGAVMPDSLLWVAARSMQLRGVNAAVAHRLALGIGCTSAMAWGDATTDGKLMHARNFDYHGVDCWPSTAAVIFHRPTGAGDGGGDAGRNLRYVSVSAAGVPLGGVTAMNEAGLTLTVHQHMFTDGTRLGGTPIGVVGDRVMRDARDLDEAEAILREQPCIGAWTYLIGDGNRREVLCFEENPARKASLRFGGSTNDETTFGYANIYLDAELGATERDLYGSYWRANLGRQQRVRQLLARSRQPHDATAMARMLGDTGSDDTSSDDSEGCRLREAIAMLMTVGSVVFKPQDGLLWVGTGEAPTSHQPFEPFSLHSEDHAPEHGQLDPGVDRDGAAYRAFSAYRDAYLAYVDRDDTATARAKVREACALAPRQSLYQALAGLLALGDGDAAEARASFDRAIALGHRDDERVAQFHLWRGRARDIAGQRDDALADYRAALARRCDEPVAKAARRQLERPYRARQARRIAVDFAFADVVSP